MEWYLLKQADHIMEDVEDNIMEPIFILSEVRKRLDKEQWEDDDWEVDSQRRTIFIGTVFNLLPSGKYYMPWAASNVTEEEDLKDAEWFAQAETELEQINCYIDSGEGSPTDLFICEFRDKIKIEENAA